VTNEAAERRDPQRTSTVGCDGFGRAWHLYEEEKMVVSAFKAVVPILALHMRWFVRSGQLRRQEGAEYPARTRLRAKSHANQIHLVRRQKSCCSCQSPCCSQIINPTAALVEPLSFQAAARDSSQPCSPSEASSRPSRWLSCLARPLCSSRSVEWLEEVRPFRGVWRVECTVKVVITTAAAGRLGRGPAGPRCSARIISGSVLLLLSAVLLPLLRLFGGVAACRPNDSLSTIEHLTCRG